MPLHQHGHDPAAAILMLFQVISIVIGANASFRDWTPYDPLDVKRKAHSAYKDNAAK